ncbi:hypothetical protein Psi02_23650 [Planotetraspora silvatica]|uniref:Uncharacterized protein n=1 Tax=Planotetraspora silvatica TaxID=234614 RepID=A0A8J3UK39_9ACTN|nr:hypothetical protein [Planotetraspora silvatica]GII45941.1 hypothetical protein Psi02_23650 [Planotetraspora silvatica]
MAKLDGMDPKLVREMLADLQRAAKRLDTLDARIAQLTRGAGVAVQATHHPAEVADACRGMVKDVTDRLALLEKQEKQRRQVGHEALVAIISSTAPKRAVTDDGPRETGKGAGPKREPVTRPPEKPEKPEKREPVRPRSKHDPTKLGPIPGDGVHGGSPPGDSKPGDSKPGDSKPGVCPPGQSGSGGHDGPQSGWTGTPNGRVSDSGKHRRRPYTGPARSPHDDRSHDLRPQRPGSPDLAGTPGSPDATGPAGSGPRTATTPAGMTAGLGRDPAAAFDPADATRNPVTVREPYLVLGAPVPDGPLTGPGGLDQRPPVEAGVDPRTASAAGTWQGLPLPSAVQPVDVVSYPTGRAGDDMLWVLVDRRPETGPISVPGLATQAGEGWAPTDADPNGRWMPVQAEPHGRHTRAEPYAEDGQAGPSATGRHRSPGPADVRERPWGDLS